MLQKNLKLVGYVRAGKNDLYAEKQRLMILEHCVRHHWKIVDYYDADTDHPSSGLVAALDALKEADGIIAVDLDRFFWNTDDRLMQLRPLVEHLRLRNKVLITIIDGIETVTAEGQEVVLTMLHEWYHRQDLSLPTKTDFEADNIRLANSVAAEVSE